MRRILLFLALAASLSTCATNPATGKREFSLVSESQEIEMGKQGAQEILATMPLMPDPIQQYVRGVATRLVAVSERPTLPWSFHVLDDATVNAFAFPGGPIFVTRGILTHMNSEAELAGVLGHEIGHVTARHTAQQLTKAQLAQTGLIVGSIFSETVAGLAGVASTGLGMLFMKFGRDAEYQSDELGFRYMTKLNYDPKAISSMFTMLQRQTELGGGGRLPEWQSTHPDPENRVGRNDQRVAQFKPAGPLKLNQAEFVRVLDGMVFGENPRQGFFKDNTFNHPDLKFRFVFPQGWKTQNMPASVVGVSAEQDAMIRLALAKGSPQEALRQFLGSQGVQAGRTSNNPINGIPAATGEFQAQTEQGVLAGIISFVQYDGRTYQLLAYTPAQKYQNYTNTFLQSVQSFNRLTDQSALNVQPKRLNVVRLERDMTIDAFNRTYPSSVPFEYVVVINGVQPGALLKAGTLVKQVK